MSYTVKTGAVTDTKVRRDSSTVTDEKTRSNTETGNRYQIVSLSAVTTVDGTDSFTCTDSVVEAGETKEAGTETYDYMADTDSVEPDNTETGGFGENQDEEDQNEGDHSETAVLTLRIATEGQNTADTLAIAAPVTGNTPVGAISSADGSYTGTISWNPGDGVFQADTVYQAKVTLYAADGYSFTGNSINGIEAGAVSGVSVSEDGSTLSFTITYPQTSGNAGASDDSGNQSDSGNSAGSDEQPGSGAPSDSTGGSDSDKDNSSSEGFTDQESTASDKDQNNNQNNDQTGSGTTGTIGTTCRI